MDGYLFHVNVWYKLLTVTILLDCETAGGADIVFVLDGSGSIGSTNFELVRDFVVEVVNSFEVSPNNYQFGLQQFSDGKCMKCRESYKFKQRITSMQNLVP